MNYEYEEAPDLETLAERLIVKFPVVAHVDTAHVLFLWENVAMPKAYARCYSLADHPIGFFTSKRYAIVIYRAVCEHFTPEQITLLLYHELMHIGGKNKLRDHDVMDFRAILGISLDWTEEGADVPDILGGEYAAD